MKERDFVAQNKKKWADFEKEWSAKNFRPDNISRFYIETADDLSYAHTHYPNRLVRQYLNGIAQLLSLHVYKAQKGYLNNLIRFWKTELPLAMFDVRRLFLLSFLIFAFAMAIGIFSAMQDSSFTRHVLGNSYVDLTMENIEKGDPMAIYKDKQQAQMFLEITYNNIIVSVRTYLLSLLAGFGTITVLLYNGIMLGAFQFMFYEQGLFYESFLTVWQHGVIEISCIILAGTAGLTLAKGVLFPGTFSRLDAFRHAGRKSIVIMLGLIPLLIFSGAIEGFVTRYTEMHWSIRLSSILLSLSFVILYFVWYPYYLVKKKEMSQTHSTFLQPLSASHFSYTAIEKPVVILWKSFSLLLKKRKTLIPLTLTLALFIAAVTLFLKNYDVTPGFYEAGRVNLLDYFSTGDDLTFFASNFLFFMFSILVGVSIITTDSELYPTTQTSLFRQRQLPFAICVSIIASFALMHVVSAIILFFALPAILFLALVLEKGKGGFMASISTVKLLLLNGTARSVSAMLVLLFIWLLAMLAIQFIIISILPTVVTYLVSSTHPYYASLLYVLNSMCLVMLLFAFYMLLVLVTGLSYFTCMEVYSASELKSRADEHFPLTPAESAPAFSVAAQTQLK